MDRFFKALFIALKAAPVLLAALLLCWLGGCWDKDTTRRDDAQLAGHEKHVAFNKACDEGDYARAAAAAQALTAEFPRNGSAWNCLGYAVERMGRLGDAINAYRKAVEVSPRHSKAWYNLGICRGRGGSRDAEIECYQHAVRWRPDYAKAWRNLSFVYAQKGEPKIAAKALARAMKADPYILDRDAVIAGVRAAEVIPQGVKSMIGELAAKGGTGEALHYFQWNDAATWAQRAKFTDWAAEARMEWACPFFLRVEKSSPLDLRISPESWNNRGMEREKASDFAGAIICYREALKGRGEDPMVWNNLAIAQVQAGRRREAFDSFEKAAKLSKVDPKLLRNLAALHYLVGESLWKEGRDVEACTYFAKGLALDADNVDARTRLARMYMGKRRWGEAREQYQIITRDFPSSGLAWYGLAICEFHLGRKDQVLPCLTRSLECNQDHFDVWMWFGTELGRAARFREAADAFERCAAMKPDDSQARYHLGLARARLGSWDEAAKQFRKAIALRDDLKLHMALASTLQAAGRFKEAVAEYRRVLEGEQPQPLVCLSIAECHADAADWDMAAKAAREVAAMQPKDPLIWVRLADVYADMGDIEQSRDAYLKAVAGGAKDPRVFLNLGVMQSWMGDPQAALRAFEQSTVLLGREAAGDAVLLSNTALILNRLGRKDEALRALRQLERADRKRAEKVEPFLRKAP